MFVASETPSCGAMHTYAGQNLVPPHAFEPVFPDGPIKITRVIWGARRIPVKRGSIRGFHPGISGSIQFESLFECDVISSLVANPELVDIRSQPFTIYFVIGDGRREHRYTPDLLVQFSAVPEALVREGFSLLNLIEIKPRAKLADNAASLGRAYSAVREITSAPFLIVCDRQLRSVPWGPLHD